MTTTNTMSLETFLAQHAICRVWYSGFDAPAGSEYVLNTETDCDEDYCDEEGLMSILSEWLGADNYELTGTVSEDADGEHRWEWDGDADDFRNCRGNSVYRLTVWGE